MAASGPGELTEIHGRLTGDQYVKIMEEVMLPSVRAMLLPEPQTIYIAMDNSPIHNSRTVQQWFQEHPEVQRIEWPARSPDLMPIENLWAQMSWRWNSGAIRNKENLLRHAYEIWESFRSKDLCEKLVASMPKRLNQVIDARGSYIKY